MDVLKAALCAAQVKPALTVLDAKGQRVRNIQVTRWTNGGVEIVSIFRHAGLAEPARVVLDEPQNVYDLKNHAELGTRKFFELKITPSRAQFFALSKQPLGGAQVSVMAASVAPGQLQQAKIAFPQASGQQAVKLTVTQPDGQPADWLDRVVLANSQGAIAELPIAFNDARGTWTVTATELFTGHAGVCRFAVK